MQRQSSESLIKHHAQEAKIAIAEASAGVVVFSLRVFDSSARANGYDIKSLLHPKRSDRFDGQRKSPAQLGKMLEKKYGVALDDPWIKKNLQKFTRQSFSRYEGMTKKQSQRMADATVKAITKGWTQSDLTTALAEIAETTEAEARLIAIDEIFTCNSKMCRAISEEVGLEKYEWLSTIDARTRPLHIELHHGVFEWGEDPPDEGGHAGEPAYCRCVPGPWFGDN